MFFSNLSRSIIFAIGAAFLIFSQDHSVQLGATILLAVCGLVGFIGLVAVIRKDPSLSFASNLFAATVSLTLAMFLLTVNGFLGLQNNAQDLVIFRLITAVFVLIISITEFLQSRKAQAGDRLEFLISAAIGLLTGLIFIFAPLDDVNAVGFLSAYLAISAVQRAIWISTPGKIVNNAKK